MGTRLVAGRYEIKDMTVRDREPLNQELDWHGMSGAALLSGGRMIGIVIARKQANQRYDFSAVRIETLLAIPEFVTAIRGQVALDLAGSDEDVARIDAAPSAGNTAAPTNSVHSAGLSGLGGIGKSVLVRDDEITVRKEHTRGSSESRFISYIRNKSADFVGRAKFFTQIEAFTQLDRGYLIVEGAPGVGKTSLLAQFVQMNNWPVHYFNQRSVGQTSRRAFLEELRRQLHALALKTGFSSVALPKEEPITEWLFELSEQLSERGQEEKILIVIDALDEAEPAQMDENTLGLPERLPSGVFVIASARSGSDSYRLAVLDPDTPVKRIIVDSNDTSNDDDINYYLTINIHKSARIVELIHTPCWEQYILNNSFREEAALDVLARILTTQSEGNFMCAYQFLKELQKGEHGLYKDRNRGIYRTDL